MQINNDVTEIDLESVFYHIGRINTQLSECAKEIITLETDKRKLSKPSIYAFSIINRAIAINNGYLTLAKENNYVAAINFLRIQCDNCMRFHAMSLSKDIAEFFDNVEAGKYIRDIYSQEGKQMTDTYLSKDE